MSAWPDGATFIFLTSRAPVILVYIQTQGRTKVNSASILYLMKELLLLTTGGLPPANMDNPLNKGHRHYSSFGSLLII